MTTRRRGEELERGILQAAAEELRESGYAARRAAERGEGESVAGGWGR